MQPPSSNTSVADARFGHIDEILGNSGARFFGNGYRLVEHEIVDIHVDTSNKNVAAVAAIRYPSSWSTKLGGELVPHLSTVDALTLGAQLAEVYLRTAHGLEQRDADRMWLARTVLKSGTTPTLDLLRVPLLCRLLRFTHSTATMCGHLSIFAVQIGTLQLELTIDHPVRSPTAGRAYWSQVEELLGPAESRFFGAAYRTSELSLHDIELDALALRVCARFDLVNARGGGTLRGLGASNAPFVSPIEGVVIIGQLAQALLYRIDHVDRRKSQNLWMRKVVIESPRPCPAQRGHHAETWSSKMQLLSIKGSTWRTGTFSVAMSGLSGEYSVAHQLPDGVRVDAAIARDVRARDRETAPRGRRSVAQ